MPAGGARDGGSAQRPDEVGGPVESARPRLLVILGPTGTGKSALALSVAERLGGEIVGGDAVQVYRGFDVGTAKPTAQERARVPHHLVDILDPTRHCSMAEFVRLAQAAITQIAGRGRVPVVAGGTGLYLRGLLRGVVDAPAHDPVLRDRLCRMARRHGSARLHRWLAGLDPESARRVAAADVQRVTRALEFALSGEGTWSERLSRRGTWHSGGERYPTLKIGLDMDREALGRRLDRRVDAFFEAGLVQEVRDLVRRNVPTRTNAFKAIGYREILDALRRGGDPEAARDEIKRNTRLYAKRQRTWFRKEPGVRWLDAAREPDQLVRRVVELWHEPRPPRA